MVNVIKYMGNLSDLGGEKLSEKTVNKQKEHEEKWHRFKKLNIDKSKLKPVSQGSSFNRLIKSRIMPLNRLNSIRQSCDTTEESQLDSTSNQQKRVPLADTLLKESVEESTYLDADESFTHSKITKRVQNQQNELMYSLTESSKKDTSLMEGSINQEPTSNVQNTLIASQDNTISNFDFCLPKEMQQALASKMSIDSARDNAQFTSNTQTYTGTKSSTSKGKQEVNVKTQAQQLRPKIPKPERPRQKKDKDIVVQLTKHELELLKIGDAADLERIFNRNSNKQERKNSISLKALSGPIHAVW